ncbi:DUF131 domain-containing protein, partial [Candidatus Woesearchaeota archaeon]|nr:DUF131 domain-containing protein [Candidatus Woesearchaeota archaeon]
QLITLGVVLIVLGLVIVFFGILKGSKDSTSTKVAVGGFIGPIPFGFGNDKSFVWFVTILSLAVFLIWLLFSFKFVR